MNIKLTKQGVRDLNALKGKSRGIRLQLPPADALICQHRRKLQIEDGVQCLICEKVWLKKSA